MFEDILKKKIFTREEKVLLSIIINLNELAEMGVLTEGPFQVIDMERAIEIVGDTIPTEDEINKVMLWMIEEGYFDDNFEN